MKKIMVVIAGLLLTAGVNAQTKEDIKEGSNSVRAMVGSSQATTSFGLDYERRAGTFGLGGKVLHSTKNDKVGKFESTTFGAQVISHLYDRSDLDVYIGAGLALSNIKDAVNPYDTTALPSDETLFGPTMTVGVLYTLNANWAVGLEYYTIYNGFSEKVAESYDFSNLVIGYNF